MQYPGNVAERKTTPCNKGYMANACLWPFTLAIEATALLMTMRSKYPLHLSTSFYHKNPCTIYRVSIKSFPDYKHLLQENYVEYKHIFYLFSLPT
jgi:hypothetical protein